VPKPNRKPGRAFRRWTFLRRLVQALAFLALLTLLAGARGGRWPAWLTDLPIRLDPLTALSSLVAGRTLIPGVGLALIIVVLTLVVGRVWCGWLCPLGTLLDWFSLRRWRVKRTEPSSGWRKVKYGLLLTTVFAAFFGNLTLLVFDPLTILVRTLSVSVWPALDKLITFLETLLYRIPVMRQAVSNFDGLVRPFLLPEMPIVYRGAALFAGVFIVIVLLNLAAERFWCRYVCPLGGLLGLLSKVALVRRRVGEDCVACPICARVCPTGTIQTAAAYSSDPSECSVCMLCVDECPVGASSFPFQVGLADWQPYDPGRREALASLGVAVAGVVLLRKNPFGETKYPYLVRPPGVLENELLSKCVRCGKCIRVCPTGALHPASMEAGIEGMWTPVVVPRLGYCDYACHACGQNCPVAAIPPLSLEQKRLQVIGKVHIDEDRCIAWAEDGDCIVCEEMCPLPEKAILLEEELIDVMGEPKVVQRPTVEQERCIGCGICEYKCPVDGQAAIRVIHPRRLRLGRQEDG
jgi:MauM/NapG family ferredoxin protein